MTARGPGLPGGRKGDVLEAAGELGSEVGPEGAELPPPEDEPNAGGAAPDGQAQAAVPEIEPPLREAVTAAMLTSSATQAWCIKSGRPGRTDSSSEGSAAVGGTLPNSTACCRETTHERRVLPSGQRPSHLVLRNSCSHPSLQPPPP